MAIFEVSSNNETMEAPSNKLLIVNSQTLKILYQSSKHSFSASLQKARSQE